MRHQGWISSWQGWIHGLCWNSSIISLQCGTSERQSYLPYPCPSERCVLFGKKFRVGDSNPGPLERTSRQTNTDFYAVYLFWLGSSWWDEIRKKLFLDRPVGDEKMEKVLLKTNTTKKSARVFKSGREWARVGKSKQECARVGKSKQK